MLTKFLGIILAAVLFITTASAFSPAVVTTQQALSTTYSSTSTTLYGKKGIIPNPRRGVDKIKVKWNANYRALKIFAEREGHCNVPPGHKEKGTPLGRWVQNQRIMKQRGRLYPLLEQRLKDVGLTLIEYY
mmetsp:Transcript_19446/g.22241  ORF Transcript_19446/g.22241 Transcript_19446/m.22241 type:complete len:131 (-) Transcript_19446:236-628(-)